MSIHAGLFAKTRLAVYTYLLFVAPRFPPCSTVGARDSSPTADSPEQPMKFDFVINLKPPNRLA
jgi:hypothetical protein